MALSGDVFLGERTENRSINRIPVRITVSQRGKSASLGRTRDLSLQGVFIETREPFDVGAVLPLSLELDPRAFVHVRAEVVRRTPEGMGLVFRDFDRDSARRLRRWAVDQTSVAGSRKQVEQLLEESARIEPIRGVERIRGLMSEIKSGGAVVTLIPIERAARDYARLVAVDASGLSFAADAHSSLTPGEDVYGLLTLAFVSYSFALRVRSVGGTTVRCDFPEVVVFSERRLRTRLKAPPGAVIRWPSPWQKNATVELPLVDVSDDGLSFRAPVTTLLTPGTPLEGASVTIEGRTELLQSAEVRNLHRVDDDGDPWLRVGVALGAARLGRQNRTAARVRARTPIGRLVERMKTVLSVVLHRSKERLGGNGPSARRVTVRGGNLPIVGILDRTTDSDERVSAPLVIVVPGFAGRKEQLSFLAGIIVDGFQRQNADIAVLRIDGSNNLGESGKDPDCRRDGMHCMHYSVTGIVQDTLAALAWAKNNPYVDPTHIVLVSMSMSSIGVRHVMTLPEGGDVTLWFSYMGAADAIDTVKNVSGNVDFHAYFMRGEKVGYISLNGVLTDGDYFWRDLHSQGLGYLDSARAEMAKIRADVVWLRGKHDAFMDPRRVEALMRVPASGEREIIDVDSGHLPRTSDEAIAQFVNVSQRIWKHAHGSAMPRFAPSIGRLAVKAEAEWKMVRRENIADRTDWWRRYLLDTEGLGFDIVEYAPDYTELMDLQVARTLEHVAAPAATAPLVLDLGAGTGNLSRRLVERGARVIASDLVPEALEVMQHKLGAHADRFRTLVADLEGSPWIALKRFVRGDLPNAGSLAERVPGVQKGMLATLLEHDGDELHGILMGHDIDLDAFVKRSRLAAPAARLLADLNLLAKVVRGRVPAEAAKAELGLLAPSLLEGNRGLPEADDSVDAAALSLVLSYLAHPDDVLSEIFRVLKPGGTLVVSSMVHDSDSSKQFLNLVHKLENLPESELPPGADPAAMRKHLANSARRFVDHAGELFRLEEEGLFRFYSGSELANAVARRGFVSIQVEKAFGAPPQAVVVSCRKP